MSGYAMLADRIASLLPNTTAGACVPASSWYVASSSAVQLGVFCQGYGWCRYSCYGDLHCSRAIC